LEELSDTKLKPNRGDGVKMKRFNYGLIGIGIVAVLCMVSMQGCDNTDDGGGLLDDIADQCGFNCSAEGVAEGNASISGIAEIDGFFAAVVEFNKATARISGKLNASLDAIAASVELEPGAAGADIAAAVDAKINAAVSGGLEVKAQPAKCEVSAEAVLDASAKCDAEVDPGSAKVECSGSCEVEASAEASCSGDAELVCRGTAPSLECSGTCTGSCQLEVAASCEGTCRGTCDGECSVQDASGQCSGKCEGKCEGECQMSAGGKCEGKCEGECEYTPPSGECEANAKVECKASADASVECEGRCNGEVTPPSVKAECEANVQAQASVSMECTPPSLEVVWNWSAELEGDVDAQAEFKAWLQGFKTEISAMLAAQAEAEAVLDAGGGLVDAAGNAVVSVVDGLKGDADFKVAIGAKCALEELPNAATEVKAGIAELQGSVEGAVAVLGSASL